MGVTLKCFRPPRLGMPVAIALPIGMGTSGRMGIRLAAP